jgi:hypothetical protein
MLNSQFLSKAAEETDPVERLKMVACYFISGLYVNSTVGQGRLPINPIIGETI